MKYRALWSHRPLSAIEEEEGEEGEEGEGGEEKRPSSRERCNSYCKVLTPHGSLKRPPDVLSPRGYAISPDGGSTFSTSLNKIIDTATINIIGFEESFAAHLSDEACSLMWNLCQVYGKTRMAIDLVERELIASKQEMEVAKHVFEELSVTENDLCDSILQTITLREIAELNVLKLRQEYRKALDENAIIKLKTNRYQLHLDRMENACSEISHQNYSVKAFMAICREKEKKQTTKPVKGSRYPVRHVTTDILVNGRFCNSPRRHCPKVDLSLPNPGQIQSERTLYRFPPGYKRSICYLDKKVIQRVTDAVTWIPDQDIINEEALPSNSLSSLVDNHADLPHFTGSAAVSPDIPSQLPGELKKVVVVKLSESAKGPPKSEKPDQQQQAVDEGGFIIIPEFEVDEDVEDPDSAIGRTAEQSAADKKAKGDMISCPETHRANRQQADDNIFENADQEGNSTFAGEQTSLKRRGEDYATEEGTGKVEDVNEEPVPTSSDSTDDISITLRETVSSYLAGTGSVKDVESIAKSIQKQAHSDTTLQHLTGGAPHIAQPGRTGCLLTPFMMARGVGVQKDLPEHQSNIPCISNLQQCKTSGGCTRRTAECSSPCTTHRNLKLKKMRNPLFQRPATCASVYSESATSGQLKRPNVHAKKRAVSVMNDSQSFLPPLTTSQPNQKQTSSIIRKTRESRPVLVKDTKGVASLPRLGKSLKHVSKSPRVRSTGPKQTSEKLRAQVQSVTRQVLPALPTAETPHTNFHQVLLIRSCSSEKLERPSLPSLHSDRCRAPALI